MAQKKKVEEKVDEKVESTNARVPLTEQEPRYGTLRKLGNALEAHQVGRNITHAHDAEHDMNVLVGREGKGRAAHSVLLWRGSSEDLLTWALKEVGLNPTSVNAEFSDEL